MSDASVGTEVREASTAGARLLAAGRDRLAVILGVSLAIMAIYWPSAKALDGVWRGSAGVAYMDGYMLLLASLWLIARDRAHLAEHPIRPAPWAGIIVALLSAVWVWCWRAVIQDPQLVLMPLLWLTAIATVLGWRTARSLAIPIGLLYFAMPAVGDINGILQDMSARANGALMWVSGIPGYMHGNLIEVPAGAIKIAGGCSGLDQFIVGLALAVLYGGLCRDPWRRRLTWVAVMGALSLICNWVRIFIITVVAYETDMHASLVRHHLWLGWVLFLIFFLGFLWAAEAWNSAHPLEVQARPPSKIPTESALRPMSAAIALISLAALPLLAYAAGLLRSGSAADVDIVWRSAPAAWQGPMPALASDWRPHFLGASAESQRAYVDSNGRTVEVFIVAYRTQVQGAKLLGYKNQLLGGADGLKAKSRGIVDASTGRWRETVAINIAGSRSLIWSTYLIGSRRFVRPRMSQLWYGLAALTGEPISSLVALRASCRRNCVGARALLDAATARILPTLGLAQRTPGDAAP
jgi:EpsI family protein